VKHVQWLVSHDETGRLAHIRRVSQATGRQFDQHKALFA